MRILLLSLLAFITLPLAAQTPQSGMTPEHARACGACHGVDGVSIAAGVPNLAAQREGYLRSQMRAYRDGGRENALMNAVMADLDDAQIDGLAAYFSRQAGPADGSVSSPFLPELLTPDFPFAHNYEAEFTYYHSIYPGNQVRHYYANEIALNAARAGQALPDGSHIIIEIYNAATDANGGFILDANGQRTAAELVGYNVMAREAGWGDAVPSLLRNENWLYANFNAERQVNAGASQAACLACHLPLDDRSYLFTIEQLTGIARNAAR